MAVKDVLRSIFGDERNAGVELAQLPVKELITEFGEAIAEAQAAVDAKCIEMAQNATKEENRISIGGKDLSLFELGFQPSFYQFTEAKMELKLTVTTTFGTEWGVGFGAGRAKGSGMDDPSGILSAFDSRLNEIDKGKEE